MRRGAVLPAEFTWRLRFGLALVVGSILLASGCRTKEKSDGAAPRAEVQPADRTGAAADSLASSDAERAKARIDDNAARSETERPAAPARPAGRAVDQPRNVGVAR